MPAQRQVPPHAADPDGTHDSRYIQIGSDDVVASADLLAASVSIPAFTITSSPGIAIKTLTVTGAAVGDVVALGVPPGGVPVATKVMPWAYVSAANTVTIMFFNVLASSADIPTATWKVKVFK